MNKFFYASINNNEIFCSIGFHPRHMVDQTTSIRNKWSPRFNDEIDILWKDQLSNLQ